MQPVGSMQNSLSGAWRMMTGRPDGLRQLDLTSDGFWNSFRAIALAAPAMLMGWVAVARDIPGAADPAVSERLGVITRLAIVDVGTWVLPLVLLAAVARQVGIGDRFVHYVVATNWGSALLVWLMLPAFLIRLLFPQALELSTAVALGIFVLSLVLMWRLTNAALAKGAGMATAMLLAMLVVSLLTQIALQDLLGLDFAQ